jgi:hypothetical protein
MSTELATKKPSEELLSLVKRFASEFTNTARLWDEIKKKAKEEGFELDEIKLLIAPMLREKLTKHQIYYLFHRDEERQRVRKYRSNQTRGEDPYYDQNDDKKDIEESDRVIEYVPKEKEDFSDEPYGLNSQLGEKPDKAYEESAKAFTGRHEEETNAVDVVKENKKLRAEIEQCNKDIKYQMEEIGRLNEALAKASFVPASSKKLSLEALFEQLPSDDSTTYKSDPDGTSMILFRRVLAQTYVKNATRLQYFLRILK